MTLFYDPLSKKNKPWVCAAFITAAIIVISIILMIGQNKAAQKKVNPPQEVDIFQQKF
jgi:uncharacterized protein (DUF486 family)